MHEFKVTKEYAKCYKTCCGHDIEFYTSDDFGAPDSAGWYITYENGEFDGWRYFSLTEAKASLERTHAYTDSVSS